MLTENQMTWKEVSEYGKAYEKQRQKEYWREKNKDQNLGGRWTRDERIENCGMVVGKRRGTDQIFIPEIRKCHLPDCPDCGPELAKEDRNRIRKQMDLAKAKNPKLKTYALDGVLPEHEDALQKRIRRNGGSFTRKTNADGTKLYITQIEDVYNPEKMRDVFGKEIRPRTVVKDDDSSYETYQNRLDDIINFEETRMEHAENDSYWSGPLHKELDEEQTEEWRELVKQPQTQPQEEKCRLRYTVFIGKTLQDTQMMNEHDTWSDKLVSNMDELQIAMDELAAKDIEYFTAQGIEFDVKTSYKYVKADKWQKWNETAKAKCPSLCILPELCTNTDILENDDAYHDHTNELAEQLALSFTASLGP